LSFEGATVARRRYFDRGQLECLEPVSDGEFLEGFSESLRRSVNHFVSTMPKVGISLTGGLDSRMVMASLDAPAGSVPCYTFGSMYRTTGDVAVGKQVAARCGQPHSVLELGKPFLRGIAENLEQAVYVSDGYMGLSGAAELYVNRLARSMAPARMTGFQVRHAERRFHLGAIGEPDPGINGCVLGTEHKPAEHGAFSPGAIPGIWPIRDRALAGRDACAVSRR
jgi:asparagine synthase (glutamine-hydrolysing)